MAEYIERTEELVLAMNAGARAIENTKRYHGAVYTKDLFSENSQEIPYLLAAKVLREVSDAPTVDAVPVVRGSGSGKPMVEPVQPLTAQAAPKPMTNGDRIRAMTDEELAESDELLSGLCNVLHGQGYPCEANTCRECLIKWLGSPEKEATDGE